MNVAAISESFQNFDINPYIDKIAEQTMKARDVDGDGALTIGEAALPREEFSQLDWNGDEKISNGELKSEIVRVRDDICKNLDIQQVLSQNNQTPDPEKMKVFFGNQDLTFQQRLATQNGSTTPASGTAST